MTRRLHVHIGAPKTGTTYLQQALRAQAEQLEAAGVLVPGSHLDQFRYAAELLEQRDVMPHPRRVRASARRLVDDVRRWLEADGRSAVISHELLAAATEAQAGRLRDQFPGARITVHYTARPLSRVLPAEWQQAVKGGSAMSMRDFTAGVMRHFGEAEHRQPTIVGPAELVHKFGRLHDVPQVLRRWGGLVGPHEVHVVTVPRAPHDRSGLWRRFLVSLDLAEDLTAPEGGRPNVSLGAVEAELVRRVNRVVDQEGDAQRGESRRRLRRLALDHLVHRPDPRPIGIPEEAHGWVVHQSSRIRSYLETAGHVVVGDLEDLAVDSPLPGTVPEDQDEVALNHAAVDAIAALVRGEPASTPDDSDDSDDSDHSDD